MYQRLLEAGLQPISTTYTALISAYAKGGQLDRALDTFKQMVRAAAAAGALLCRSANLSQRKRAARACLYCGCVEGLRVDLEAAGQFVVLW